MSSTTKGGDQVRFFCCLGLSILVLALLPSLAAADSGWYIAVDAGKTQFSNDARPDAALYTAFGTGGPSSPLVHNDDGTGRRFAGGYRFNQYWGLEVGHVDLGEATSDVNIVTSPSPSSCGLSCANSYDLAPKLKAHGWTAVAIGNLPLGSGWELYGRGGYFMWRLELNDDVTPTNSPPYGNKTKIAPTGFNSSSNASGMHATYGFGVRWFFADHWTVRLGWDSYKGMAFSDFYPVDVNMRSLGVEYHF